MYRSLCAIDAYRLGLIGNGLPVFERRRWSQDSSVSLISQRRPLDDITILSSVSDKVWYCLSSLMNKRVKFAHATVASAPPSAS